MRIVCYSGRRGLERNSPLWRARKRASSAPKCLFRSSKTAKTAISSLSQTKPKKNV